MAETATLSVGRIVHAFCPSRWDGPRPGIVVKSFADGRANVKVFGDATPDDKNQNHWNLINVAIYSGSPGKAGDAIKGWCEIPPKLEQAK